MDFDYKELPGCQFGVPSTIPPDYFSECGEPATAEVWWYPDDGKMRVCQEHLALIIKEEKGV